MARKAPGNRQAWRVARQRQPSHRRRLNQSPSRRRLRVEPLEDRRLLAVVTVDTDLDVVDFSDGMTSLREAIFATNLVGGTDTIDFDAALSGQAVLLSMGELSITDSLTIDASGLEGGLTIDASGNDRSPDEDLGDGSRVFHIDDGNTAVTIDVELAGLTLTGGDVAGGGGAVLARENFALVNSLVVDNAATDLGGGIALFGGTTTMIASQITGNHTQSSVGDGGGIYGKDANLEIIDSTISGNLASRDGGGLEWVRGRLTVWGSQINENVSLASGGALWGTGNTMRFLYSELVGNSAVGDGGGIRSDGLVDVRESSVLNNTTQNSRGGGIWASGTVIIDSSTIADNQSHHDGGGIWTSGNASVIDSDFLENRSTNFSGGGLFADEAEVTVTGSSFLGNAARRDGGGLFALDSVLGIEASSFSNNSAATLNGGAIWATDPTITNSTITRNSALSGGGLFVYDATISNSSILDNSAVHDGGGIWAGRTVTIDNSLIAENETRRKGGGLFSLGETMSVTSSTISGNAAGLNGGAVYVKSSNGDSSFAHSTITGNTSDADNNGSGSGGGIHRISGPIDLDHTILAGNTDLSGVAPDIFGIVNSQFSLIGFGADLLGPLTDNGGPTFTHALLPGSPAIDAGDPAASPGVAGVPQYDQRSFAFDRVVAGRIDIGSTESGATSADFDFDGNIDGRDFLIWQRGYAIGSTHAEGDANVDQDVNADDWAIWESQYGSRSTSSADLNSDNIVNGSDFVAWQRGFGLVDDTSDLASWEATFGLGQGALSAAESSHANNKTNAVVSQRTDALSAAELVDEAMALDSAKATTAEKVASPEAQCTSADDFYDHGIMVNDIALSTHDSAELVSPITLSNEYEKAPEEWLMDELLEQVFGHGMVGNSSSIA